MHLQDVLNNNQEVYGQVGDGLPENFVNQPMKKQCHVNAVKGPLSVYGGYRTGNQSNGGAKQVLVPYGKYVKNIAVPYGSQAKKSLCPTYETDAVGHCILQLGVWGCSKPPSRSRAVPWWAPGKL